MGREGEREGKKHQRVVASCAPPTKDLAHNTGMCLEWELNWQPFDLQACTQSTEVHKPGFCVFDNIYELTFSCSSNNMGSDSQVYCDLI